MPTDLMERMVATRRYLVKSRCDHTRGAGSVARRTGETGTQLLLQAHLQRIVNGGGRIEREYALGRGRTDVLTVWPQGERERRFVVECKVLRKDLERTRGYMDRCGADVAKHMETGCGFRSRKPTG